MRIITATALFRCGSRGVCDYVLLLLSVVSGKIILFLFYANLTFVGVHACNKEQWSTKHTTDNAEKFFANYYNITRHNSSTLILVIDNI